jgi:hypothetical protein
VVFTLTERLFTLLVARTAALPTMAPLGSVTVPVRVAR